ncbi:MAG: DUF2169 domain-containing protein [Polyangiaceae bacterium]
MDLVSSGPLRVSGLRFQLSDGAPALAVVCKATFTLRPGESPLAAQQDEPAEEDTYWDDDPQRSLSASTDLVPFKARADVLVVGYAYSKVPVRSLVARLSVGKVDKSIEVHTDRAFGQDGVLREGKPFTKMRLSYERAAGGPDTSNPAGMRFDQADPRGNLLLPNLQPLTASLSRRGDTFPPIGFGPIAPLWPDRLSRIHRSALGWSPYGWTEAPLPEGLDRAYFNVAPADQQLDTLPSGLPLFLEHLHAEHDHLSTQLADVVPHAVIDRPGQSPQPLGLTCDTLTIDTDRGLCHLVWRGTVRLLHPHEVGRIIVSMEEASRSWDSRQAIDDAGRHTLAPFASSAKASSAMPFSLDARQAASDDGDRVTPRPPAATSALPFQRDSAPRDGSTPLPRPSPPTFSAPPAHDPKPAPRPPPPRPSAPSFASLDTEGTRVLTLNPAPGGGLSASVPLAPAPPPAPSSPAQPQPAMPPARPSPPSFSATGSNPAVSPPPPGSMGTMPPPAAAGNPSLALGPLSAGSTPIPRPSPPAVPPPIVPAGKAPSASPWATRGPSADSPPPMGPLATGPIGTAFIGTGSIATDPIGTGSMGTGSIAGSMGTGPIGTGSIGERLLAEPPPPAPLPADRRRGEPEHLGAIAKPAPASPSAAMPSFLAAAAMAGVVSASNAAADPLPARPARADTPAATPAKQSPPEAVDLLWFDADSVARVRRKPPWRALLTDLLASAEVDAEEASLGNTPEEIEDRRDVLHVLVHGAALDHRGIEGALEQSVRADGKIIPPLIIATGQLSFVFDELEMLKATLSAALPFAPGDEQLTAATGTAKDFLATPGLLATGTVIESLTTSIRDTFARTKRAVPADYLTVQAERALLEKRHYQKREVFSKTHLRGLYTSPGAETPIPVYLPEDIARKLPLFQSFSVRLIAEVHRAADESEPHKAALRALALGRTQPKKP